MTERKEYSANTQVSAAASLGIRQDSSGTGGWSMGAQHSTAQRGTAQHGTARHSTAHHSTDRDIPKQAPLSKVLQILKSARLACIVVLLLIALQPLVCTQMDGLLPAATLRVRPPSHES